MDYFEHFFKFPSVEADMENEMTKKLRAESTGLAQEFNVDYVIVHTEIGPDNEILNISEGWYPNDEGFNEVRETGNFPCTRVTFTVEGDYLIDWPIDIFKNKWSKYKDSLPEQEMQIVQLNGKEEITEFLKQLSDGNIE